MQNGQECGLCVYVMFFDNLFYRFTVVLFKGVRTVGFGDDEFSIGELRDLSFSGDEHFIALKLKPVKVENIEMGAEHALEFIDSPSERNVDLEFFFCVDDCESFGFFAGQVGRKAGSDFVESLD